MTDKCVKIEEFDAVSENGRRFRLQVFAEMIDVSSLDDPSARLIRGSKIIRTSEGHHCNYIDDDNYEIVELGMQIRRI